MIKNIFLAVLVSALSYHVTAQTSDGSVYQMTRFEKSLSALEKLFTSDKDLDKVISNLIESSDGRISAFNLQALGRIYSEQDSLFAAFRSDFKSIEDNIGKIDKWNSLKNKAKEEKAIKEFSDILKKNRWSVNGTSPKLEKIRSDLKKYSWPSAAQDRQFILTQLVDDLDSLNTTAYNFSKLETVDGLHEFRREVRWVTMKARVLNGALVYKPGTACPVEELKNIINQPIASSKYAQLPTNPAEKNSCQITQCLFVDMASIVEQIGAIKDEVEQQIGNTDSDTTPENLRIKAEKVYDAFKARNTLSRLATDIKSCQK